MGAVRLSLAAGGSQHAGGAVPAQAKVVVAVGCRKATGAGARGRGQAGFARKAASSETSSECVPALQPHPSPLCHNTLRGGATPRLSAAPRAALSRTRASARASRRVHLLGIHIHAHTLLLHPHVAPSLLSSSRPGCGAAKGDEAGGGMRGRGQAPGQGAGARRGAGHAQSLGFSASSSWCAWYTYLKPWPAERSGISRVNMAKPNRQPTNLEI